MTDRDKCKMVLDLLTGNLNRLDNAQVLALGIQQHPDTPVVDLHFAERDFAWRGEVASGPLKGSPLKVDPVEVKDGCVRILMDVFDKLGAFKRPRKVVTK